MGEVACSHQVGSYGQVNQSARENLVQAGRNRNLEDGLFLSWPYTHNSAKIYTLFVISERPEISSS